MIAHLQSLRKRYLKHYMKKEHIGFLLLLLVSISGMRLQAMGLHPQAWERAPNPKTFREQASAAYVKVRNVIALELRGLNRPSYLERALWLKDQLFEDYKHGKLLSIGGIEHARVESIDMHVINAQYLSSKTCELYRQYAELQLKAAWRASPNHHDEKVLKWRSRLHYVSGLIYLLRRGANGVYFYDRFNKKPVILFDIGKDLECPYEYVILHELAHAFDPVLKAGKQDLDSYHWLKDDVNNCNFREVMLKEWHADKQAVAWIKKYTPDEAKKIIGFYYKCCCFGWRRPKEYPPCSVMLAWLRDPKV